MKNSITYSINFNYYVEQNQNLERKWHIYSSCIYTHKFLFAQRYLLRLHKNEMMIVLRFIILSCFCEWAYHWLIGTGDQGPNCC